MRTLWMMASILGLFVQAAFADDLDSMVAQCGGGITLSVDGDLQGKIAEAYEEGDVRGDEFVLNRSASIFQNATPSERIPLLQIFTDCIKFSMAQKSGTYVPAYPEPTEREMLAAHQARFGKFLNEATGGAVIQNPINGIALNIASFEKHECRISARSVGYNCSYSVKVDVGFFSNEGTSAGNEHATAVQTLFDLFTGGQARQPSTNENRFFKSGARWLVAER